MATQMTIYTAVIVRNFFDNYHEYRTYVETGNPSHLAIWLDVHKALLTTDLTDIERDVLARYYFDYQTVYEINEVYPRYSRQGIESILKRSIAKITKKLSQTRCKHSDVKLRKE